MGEMEKLSASEFHDQTHHDDGHHGTHVKVAHH
jgi:hypothetical protein